MNNKTTLEILRQRILEIESSHKPSSAYALDSEEQQLENRATLNFSTSSFAEELEEKRLSGDGNYSSLPSQADSEQVFSLSDQSSESQLAFKKVQQLLLCRDRSCYEISTRLQKEGFSERAIYEAIDKARKYDYLNDERFAEILIRSRLSQGKGKAGIQQELRKHHISINTEKLYEANEKNLSEVDRAVELLNRKPIRAKQKYHAALRKCLSNGFSADDSYAAVKLWMASQKEC